MSRKRSPRSNITPFKPAPRRAPGKARALAKALADSTQEFSDPNLDIHQSFCKATFSDPAIADPVIRMLLEKEVRSQLQDGLPEAEKTSAEDQLAPGKPMTPMDLGEMMALSPSKRFHLCSFLYQLKSGKRLKLLLHLSVSADPAQHQHVAWDLALEQNRLRQAEDPNPPDLLPVVLCLGAR